MSTISFFFFFSELDWRLPWTFLTCVLTQPKDPEEIQDYKKTEISSIKIIKNTKIISISPSSRSQNLHLLYLKFYLIYHHTQIFSKSNFSTSTFSFTDHQLLSKFKFLKFRSFFLLFTFLMTHISLKLLLIWIMLVMQLVLKPEILQTLNFSVQLVDLVVYSFPQICVYY